MSWSDLIGSAVDADTLKQSLPLQYVVGEAGVPLESVGERLVSLCPFHEDTKPSFAVFGEDLDRCGCWSCDFGTGDVIDFIQRWKEVSFSEALVVGGALLRAFENDVGWEPLVVERIEPDRNAWLDEVRRSFTRVDQDPAALARLLVAKHVPASPKWMRDEFRVGVMDGNTVMIPHFSKSGALLGYKTRYGEQHAYATGGSRFDELYGSWRDEGQEAVILCEGESDTWMVGWTVRDDETLVLGLPAGAGALARDEWVDQLRDRHVVLFFDGDASGRSAVRRWAEALKGVSASLAVVVLQEGQDACSIGVRGVEAALRAAAPVRSGTGPVLKGRDSYVRASNGDMVSDWVMNPHRYLIFEDGTFGFEGTLSNGKHAVIASEDMASEAAIKRWAARHQAHWFGSSKDAQWVSKLLADERPFLTAGKGTYLAGWHGDAFVTPDSSLGPGASDWIYVPSVVADQMKRIVTLWQTPETGNLSALVGGMLKLNRRDVVDSMIGWIAASVVRSAMVEFPVLAVVGGAGVGKTTVVDALMGAFGFGGGEQNLTSTTRYGLSQLVAGSCGVPVWIDEYRHGANPDTLLAMEQIIRDAWRSSASLRGGVGTNWSQVSATRASAPILVSGEDVFSETSLIERIVLIRVPQDLSARDSEALQVVRRNGQLGRAYIEWLLAEDRGLPSTGGLGRQETGQAIVRWGWSLFREFCADVGKFDIGEMVAGVDIGTDDHIPPYVELVIWGMDQSDSQLRPLVWREEEGRWIIRPRELMRVAKAHDWRLPGGERAMSDWLVERYGGYRTRTAHGWAVTLEHAEELDTWYK